MAEKKSKILDFFSKGAETILSLPDKISAATEKKSTATPSTTVPTYTVPDLSGKKYSNIDLSKYDKGWQASDETKRLGNLYSQAVSTVDNWKADPFARENDYQSVIDQILNRDKFSYDLNGDSLYQQYKDRFTTQGKQASMDVMGQAAAMTGGYGNSYAATVGNQAYQGYLQQLNDVVPQLYQMALERYNLEGNQLESKYGLLSNEKALHEAAQQRALDLALSNRDHYSTAYNNQRSFDYGTFSDQRNHDTTQFWNETNFGYGRDQDAIANEMAAAQLRESIRANEISEKKANEKANSVDYAITTYSAVPEGVHNEIKKVVESVSKKKITGNQGVSGGIGFDTFNVTNEDEVGEALNNYLTALVDAEEISPSVASALMRNYMSNL